MKKNITLILLFGINLFLSSQNETRKWYFGQYAGLDVGTTSPQIFTNSVMFVDEGCTSASDQSGNLLFYASGTGVVNRLHQTMANGSGLNGHSSSSQGALAVKQPGNNNIYYLFTLDAQNLQGTGMQYSVINMNLAAGNGSVTSKNNFLYGPVNEHMSAVKHCNGIDVWIMTHEWNSNNFRAYLLTAAGVNTVPVISSIGQVYSGNSAVAQGCMKFSPSGHKLGMTVHDPSSPYGSVELYDFDRASGVVSNSLVLSSGVIITPYGCEFSHDGTKFYAAGWYTPLYQWDLCAGSPSAIVASQYTMAGTQITGMQMAPNGKIYVARAYQQVLGVINSPNLAGAACNYVNLGQSVAPKSCQFNLPNFVTSYFDQSPALPPAQPFTYASTCNTASFNVTYPVSTSGCGYNAYNVTAVSWNFGDPGSGAANTSTLQNPVHTFPGPGTYMVRCVLDRCKKDTLVQAVVINQSGPALSISGNTIVCGSQVASLTAQGANAYLWSNGMAGSSATFAPTGTGTFAVTGTSTNSCASTLVFTLAVYPLPSLSLSAQPSAICAGNTSTISASGGDVYSWSQLNNGGSATLSPATTTVLNITGTSTLSGCQASSSLILTVNPLPQLSVSGAMQVCKGETAILTASGANSYSWSIGSTSSSIAAAPSVSGTLSVTGTNTLTGCSKNYTLALKVSDCVGLFSESQSRPVDFYLLQAENQLVIENAGGETVCIYDSAGKLLFRKKVEASKELIDFHQFAAGVYLVVTERSAMSRKVLKQQ